MAERKEHASTQWLPGGGYDQRSDDRRTVGKPTGYVKQCKPERLKCSMNGYIGGAIQRGVGIDIKQRSWGVIRTASWNASRASRLAG